MITEAHNLLADQLLPLVPEADNAVKVLRKCVRNYRAGKGMSLSREAFLYLDKKKYYTFHKFPIKSQAQSKHLVWLDKCSVTPYYIGRQYIYISDPLQQFTYSLVEDFEGFIEYLKNSI